MTHKKLTVPYIDSLTGAKARDYTDPGTRGLVLRVHPSGQKVWRLIYRVAGEGGTGRDGRPLQGKNKSITLGRYPQMGLSDARASRDEYWDLAKAGTDPARQRLEAIHEQRESEALTFEVVARQYLTEAERGKKVGRKGAITAHVVARRKSDLDEYILPKLGDRPIADIYTPELIRFLDWVDGTEGADKHPTRVDRVLECLRAAFYFAKEIRHYIQEDPATSIKARVDMKERERDRELRKPELRALWAATADLGNYGRLVRVLALTGQRRGEVAGIQWKDLDLEAGVWRLPKKKTKARRVHEIPLSRPVLEIVGERGRAKDGDIVFPGVKGAAISAWNKLKTQLNRLMEVHLKDIDENAEFEHWRLHDLRRTAATKIEELGTEYVVVQLILNHDARKLMGATRRYSRGPQSEKIKEALELWASELMRIVSPDNVVDLRERMNAG